MVYDEHIYRRGLRLHQEAEFLAQHRWQGRKRRGFGFVAGPHEICLVRIGESGFVNDQTSVRSAKRIHKLGDRGSAIKLTAEWIVLGAGQRNGFRSFGIENLSFESARSDRQNENLHIFLFPVDAHFEAIFEQALHHLARLILGGLERHGGVNAKCVGAALGFGPGRQAVDGRGERQVISVANDRPQVGTRGVDAALRKAYANCDSR